MKSRRQSTSYSFSSSGSSSSSENDDDHDKPEDDDFSMLSDNASDRMDRWRKRKKKKATSGPNATSQSVLESPGGELRQQNVLYKILNRERTGYFATGLVKSHQMPFRVVPSRLSFCLMEIVPVCYLSGHIFMGLTVCGQFLLSYKLIVCDEPDFNQFSAGSYKYELFFWIYRPHQLLRKYYSICLFDDHGVDNMKTVTMCQWFRSTRTLIVHGASEDENEDSFVSIVAVPRLGCLDCRQLRDEHFSGNHQSDASSRSAALCITCNLTIHTKYTRSESDPRFNPRINLNCPNRLILFTNGLIHMLSIDLQTNKPPKTYSTALDVRYVQRCKSPLAESKEPSTQTIGCLESDNCSNVIVVPKQSEITDEAAPPEDIVARIIADFDECDTTMDVQAFHKSAASKRFEEQVINTSSVVPVSISSTQKSRFVTHRRLIPSPSPSLSSVPAKPDVAAASRAYEFSEETEKYEKISSFRKRRLADKKYEFSEDNSENIIPFAKLRMRRQTRLVGSPTLSSDSGLSPQTTQHTHRASPSHGFRSPCGSPVGNRFIIMSPPSGVRGVGMSQLYARSPTYKSFQSSPRHVVHTKRTQPAGGYHFDVNEFISSRSPYSPLLLSPRSDADFEVLRQTSTSAQPLTEVKPSNISTDPTISSINNSHSFAADKATDTKPICAKKLVRHYVEEDDTTSVITSEEDDCISPGYHTSLPVEVHGACYSGMQLVSAASYQQRLLKGSGGAAMNPAVLVTQHTFDLETLTYHIANRLCVMHNKQYGFFYDWACEPVHICPHSAILTCLLIVNFTARDATAPGAAPCLNCTNREQFDCAFHRRHFECRSIFTWNVQFGDWSILDYGELSELSPSVLRKRNSCGNGSGATSGAATGGSGAGVSGTTASELTRIVRKMARELAPSLRTDGPADWAGLWTLDSCVDRSKESLRDQHNSIEFYRGPVGRGMAGEEDDDDDDDDNLHASFGQDNDSSDSSDFG